jgi:hypothetical protein
VATATHGKKESIMKNGEILVHPSLGRLPARKVLECIFALSPTGSILHHHLEEVSKSHSATGEDEEIVYTLNGTSPTPGRERCRIIPPFVREFGKSSSLKVIKS